MTKDEFLQTLRTGRGSWEALLARADEARMVQPGVAGEWSLKDIVAHVTAYERGLVAWLEGAARGVALVFSEDIDHPDLDHRNALLFARHRDRPLDEVLAEAEEAFQRLLGLVEALPEAELLDPARSAWYVEPRWHQRRALWQCIADDSYRHYGQHAPGIRAWLGEEREAQAAEQGMMQIRVRVYGLLMAAVEDPEGWLELAVPGGTDVAGVMALLAERSPLFDARSCLAVVDGAQVPFSHRLAEGEELHLYHVFSGG